MRSLYDGGTFDYKGYTFKVSMSRDDIGEPWKWSHGHGVVSDWKGRSETRPGERVLCDDRGRSYRSYDFEESMKIAYRDGWGVGEEELRKLTAKLNRTPTKGEITARAVEMDFQRLRAWCRDEWEWVYLNVTMLGEDGRETEFSAGVGGVESDAGEYLMELAQENAEECIRQYQEYAATVNA